MIARWKGGQELAPDEPSVYYYSNYVHFVWGFNGVGNGYYLWNSGYTPNTQNPELFDEDDSAELLNIGQLSNFDWLLIER